MKKFFLLLLMMSYSSSLPQATNEQTWRGSCAWAFGKTAITGYLTKSIKMERVSFENKTCAFLNIFIVFQSEISNEFQNFLYTKYIRLRYPAFASSFRKCVDRYYPVALPVFSLLTTVSYNSFESCGLQVKGSHKVSTVVDAGLLALYCADKANVIDTTTAKRAEQLLLIAGMLTKFVVQFHEERKAQNGVGILPEAVVNSSLFNNKFVDGIAYLFSFGTINSSSDAMRVGIKIPFTS